MGFHPLDLLVIVGVALLIFGPKTLQAISHNAGRGLGHAKEAKDKLMAEVPEEFSHAKNAMSQVPLTPQQAAQRLLTPAQRAEEKEVTEHLC